MRLVTIGSLGASVALGLGAIIVARVALPDTGKVQAAQVVVSPMANAVSVVVAARDIAYGERLDAGGRRVGVDEADVARGRISWISPLARQLLKAREGDTVVVRTPGGDEPQGARAIIDTDAASPLMRAPPPR